MVKSTITLRYNVPNFSWKTHSDTETLVELISRLGLIHTLKELHGMFAFALWDRKLKKLSLARDRFGEKPLYYGRIGDGWAFASELKAFWKLPNFKREIDRKILGNYLQTGYVSGGECIYKDCFKVDPGTIIEFDQECLLPTKFRYYSYKKQLDKSSSNRFSGSDNFALKETEDKLRDVISMQMISDVPIGGFLSGGIDLRLFVHC